MVRDTHDTSYTERRLAGQDAPEAVSSGLRVTAGGEVLARKAGVSLRGNETEITREWIKELIDTLGLASLQSFPTSELSTGLPILVRNIASSLSGEDAAAGDKDMLRIAASLSNLRKEGQSIARVVDDYTNLKRRLLEAAAVGLRDSDYAVLDMAGRLDASFNQVFKAGLRSFLRQHSRQLQQLADTDPLTGLYNVRYFRRQLHSNLEMYKRYRIPFSLLMLDLDRLKELNDTLGHSAGDRALRRLAAIMRSEKRETDVAVRYGGDEFFLLLPGTSAAEAERLARRIIRLARKKNIESGGTEMTGVSVGIVSCPANGTDVGTLRARADRALQLAKSLGGGAVAGLGGGS